MPEKNCSVCNRKISLSANPSGLVFKDEFFVCEDCCGSHTEEELNELSKTIMHESLEGMPIALWLIHEQNKDKTMMTTKK
jgi:hypothetical protein